MGDIQWRDGTVTDENMNEIDPNYRFGTRARERATEAAGNTWEWLGNQPGTYLPDFDGNPETQGLQIAPSGQQIQQGLQIGGQVIGNVADYIDDEVFYGAGKELGKLKTKGDDALYQALDDRGVKVDRGWLGFTTGAALAGAEEGLLGPIAKVPKIFGRGPGTAAWLDNIFNSKRLVPDGPNGINTVKNQPFEPNTVFESRRRNVNNPDQGTLFDIEDYLGPLNPNTKAAAIRFNELIATKSGYASMAEFKKTVLNRWPKKYQDQLFRELWQNKYYEGYIEHLIQKAPHMDWYWKMKGKDRNAIENVRILFNDRVKNMKDTVEKLVHGYTDRSGTFIPGKGWQTPNLSNRLIVSFEDPQRRFKTFKRQNPGDVIIMRAGSNKIIGNLGQYLDVLYPQDALGKRFLKEGAIEAGFKNVTDFRREILSDRIDIIIRDSATIPSNRTAAKRYIKANIDQDMVNLITQYPFLQPPPAIRRQMIKDGLIQGAVKVDK